MAAAAPAPPPLTLLNWPPSRGPMPAWMRAAPRYLAPPPTLTPLTPAAAAAFDLGRPLYHYRLGAHVETVGTLTLTQALGVLAAQLVSVPRVQPGRPDAPTLRAGRAYTAADFGRMRLKPGLTVAWPTRRADAAGVVVVLDYPLERPVRVAIAPYRHLDARTREPLPDKLFGGGVRLDVAYVLWQLARAYRAVYRAHRRYGVWGHALGDLQFESLEVAADGRRARVGVGS